jgi:hypothetical protein
MTPVLRCLLLPVLLAFSACGQSVTFHGTSQVHEDGSLTRTSRFESKFTLSEQYRLPENSVQFEYGEMFKSYRNPFTGDDHISSSELKRKAFIAARRYPAAAEISGDYVRNAKFADGSAHNSISIDYDGGVFVSFYTYEERFQDLVVLESVIETIETIRDDWLAFIKRGLPENILQHVDQQSVEEAVIDVFIAEIDREVDGLRSQGLDHVYDWLGRIDDGREEYWDELNARFVARLGVDPESDDWDDFVISVLVEPFGDELDEKFEGADGEALLETLFGAHGFELFDNYEFVIKVNLPGEIRQSNGSVTTDGALLWEFSYDEFTWRPYVMTASSRLVHWDRLMLVIVLLVLLALAGARRFSRKSGSRVDET